jgi:hypothetical protein
MDMKTCHPRAKVEPECDIYYSHDVGLSHRSGSTIELLAFSGGITKGGIKKISVGEYPSFLSQLPG